VSEILDTDIHFGLKSNNVLKVGSASIFGRMGKGENVLWWAHQN
jgi:hypothetical protein